MRETRARIDRKLDALTARTTRVKARVREQTPWAVLALVGGSAAMMQLGRWMQRRRRRREIQKLILSRSETSWDPV